MFNYVIVEDEFLFGCLIIVVLKFVKEEGIVENGYCLIMNCNVYGG